MKRILAVVTAIAVIGLFGLLAWLNPGDVDFRFTLKQSARLPLGWLLVLTFLTGVLITVITTSLQQLVRRLIGWRERRRARQAVRLGEWQESGANLAWEGELERGRGLLRKAWRRQPRNPAAALALASSYMDTSEYSTAREVLESAISYDPHDPDLRYALGELLRRGGETADAIRMLETVLVEHPRAPRALVPLRELYRETHRWQDAARVQEAYLQTLSDGGRSTERERLLHFRYQAALSIENPSARVEALAAIVDSERSFVPAVVSLGDTLVSCQRADEATKVWERAFRSHPRLVFIERLLAHQETSRERQRTLALMNKYREQFDPDSVRLVATRVALDDGQFDAAAAELERIGRQETAAVQYCWAQIYHGRGQLHDAWKALSRVVNDGGAATGYRCTSCGRRSETWTGYCPECERWDTYRSSGDLTTGSRGTDGSST